jgi:Zn-finger nucleic acid-binding protein
MRRFYSPKHQIEIDECANCGGIWLDAEELEQIRELFPTQNDRDHAGDVFIQEVLKSDEFLNHEEEFKKSIDKINSVANFLKILVPFV